MSKNRGKLTVISLLVVIIVVCGGYMLLHPSSSKKVPSEKATWKGEITWPK